MTMPDSFLAISTLLKVARLPKFKMAAAKTGSENSVRIASDCAAVSGHVASAISKSGLVENVGEVAVGIAPLSFAVQKSAFSLWAAILSSPRRRPMPAVPLLR